MGQRLGFGYRVQCRELGWLVRAGKVLSCSATSNEANLTHPRQHKGLFEEAPDYFPSPLGRGFERSEKGEGLPLGRVWIYAFLKAAIRSLQSSTTSEPIDTAFSMTSE